MTLAELVPTPAHAEALARQLATTVAVFGAAPKEYEPHVIVELLAALLWDLAQRRGELHDLPRMLDTGAAALLAKLPLDDDTRTALHSPAMDRELRVWANAIDSLLRNGLLSEWIEREVAQRDPEAEDDGDDAPAED
jgi:hypothetical protein